MIIDVIIAWLHAFDVWVESIIWILISWVTALGPVGVFFGVMIETFIAPIPSPLVPMAAGFILTFELTPLESIFVILFSVMLVGALAATIGSFFGYGIAYFGGYPIIERYGKYLGTSIEEIEYMRKNMEASSRDEIYLFTARAVPIIPLSVVSVLYGALRADAKRFAFFTFLGALPRYLILGLLGWVIGVGWQNLAEMIDLFETLILVLLIVFLVVFILYRIIIRRRARRAKAAVAEDKAESNPEAIDRGEGRQQLPDEVQSKRSLGSPVVGGLLGALPHDP
ncbi:MAG: VTT domain-containing protein [Candidatus Hermodarchaeota archaeon]|nr:VTT domain-containing protein [Candidatus Hermodarchaeota archaeon]